MASLDKGMHYQDKPRNSPETLEKSELSVATNAEEESNLDVLVVKIHNLVVSDLEPSEYTMYIKYQEKTILQTCIKPFANTVTIDDAVVQIEASMTYDAADYENMCMMADAPLVVIIHPGASSNCNGEENKLYSSPAISNVDMPFLSDDFETSICIIDIFPLIIYEDTMFAKKRMEPVVTPPVLQSKSWDNLPLLTIEISVERSSLSTEHHDFLKNLNYMTITVLAAYNVWVSEEEDCSYAVGTRMPVYNDEEMYIVNYNKGYKCQDFDPLNTYKQWESLKLSDNAFALSDDKFINGIENIINDSEINIRHYILNQTENNIVWNSFHRGLLLGDSGQNLMNYIRHYKWPLELAITTPTETLSFMAHLDLFNLLYAGEKSSLLAVPLTWYDADEMLNSCGIKTVLTPLDCISPPKIGLKNVSDCDFQTRAPSSQGSYIILPTGADQTDAWILVEIKLSKPLKQVSVPRPITQSKIKQMLKEIEDEEPDRRDCTGRGHAKDWNTIVRSAVDALRRVPYYDVSDFYAFNRQLSSTRTRIEILTSFWQESALYVNDNFVVKHFLDNESIYKELLLLAHTGLAREVEAALVDPPPKGLDIKLKAARHARQLQDVKHATNLYLEYVSKHPNDADGWRELATCARDVDSERTFVCMLRALELNIRHPLTLLSMATLVFEEEPSEAECFFQALLELYPFWTVGCVVSSAYYYKMECFDTAKQVMLFAEKNRKLGLDSNIGSPRNWETELGDWWDHTPLLPGVNIYHDAADLLLRFRAVTLAEVCVSLSLSEGKETAAYYHQAALCCRLRQQISSTLCFVRTGLKKFGEITYLRSLELECLLKMKYREAAADSAKYVGSSINPFTTLLVASCQEASKARPIWNELLQRQPSAYAWMAIADDWMQRSRGVTFADNSDSKTAESYAAAYATQALKIDRRAARAWALLARLVRPKARRQYCRKMAEMKMLLFVWISLIFMLLWLYFRKTYSYFKNKGVHHLPTIPVFGTMAKAVFQKEHAIITINRLYFAFPEDRFVGDYEFLRPIVMLREPELMREICIKEFDMFQNRRLFTNDDDPVFAKSLFGLKGQKWRDMRSTLSPAFTGSKLKGMVPLVHECSTNLVDYLNSEMKKCEGEYFEINSSDLLTRYINDVVANCAFGIQINSIADKENEFYKMAKKLTSFTFFEVLKSFLVIALPSINKISKINIFSQEALDFLSHIILKTMSNRGENNTFRPDLIQILLEAKKGTLKRESTKDEKDAGFKEAARHVWQDEELVAQALIFFFAGFDTVASGITLILHELSLNTDIQTKLRCELDDSYEKCNGQVNYEEINQIKYLDMVVTEGLRKWPPAPIMERVCGKRYNLGKAHDKVVDDFYLEEGFVVGIPIYSIHHDPKYYSEPEKFDPERFSDENKNNIKPFTYMPFGLGPRNCIGARFALIEIKILIFEILRNFEVAPGPKTDVLADLNPTSFSPKMNGGHFLKFIPREKI